MRVLISAYACEPDRGSEPEAGWLWARAAARGHDVWVLTRANNRAPIESYLLEKGVAPTFVYVDLPLWLRFWKRRGRGVRVYYVLWQLLAAREARRLHARERFDLVHHVTFANMWLPALACLARAPFVLGPVGGGQKVPLGHYSTLGAKMALAEALLLWTKRLSRLNPLVRIAWANSSLILVNNEETRDALPRRYRSKARLRPHACLDAMKPPGVSAHNSPRVAFFAGRLNRFKGVSLAIRALGLLPDWRLEVAGDGKDLPRLQTLAAELGVAARVTFLGRLPREELWERLAAADAFVFPSLKEGAPFVILEAAALGVPVVAFDLNGPAALASFHKDLSIVLVPPSESFGGLATALKELPVSTHRPAPPASIGLDALAADLDVLYAEVAGTAAESDAGGLWLRQGADR